MSSTKKPVKQPVTREELIDAISKLYVIDDQPQQLRKILNNPKEPFASS